MKEQFYRLVLDEYASPSFCTLRKGYYGSLNDIKGLVDALDADQHYREHHLELINAFRAYVSGDHTITYRVAYSELPLLEPVELLDSAALRLDQFAWSHTNVWDCQYHLRCDCVETVHYWLRLKDRYLRVVKANFKNLEFLSEIHGWRTLHSHFWGFPKMIVSAEGDVYNRLAVCEKSFESLAEAETDIAAFPSLKDVDFTEFCNDIFGDG